MKAFLIIDAATEISAAAFRLDDLSEGMGEHILRRAGYGRTAEDQGSYVALVRLHDIRIETDPFRWDDPTMRAAHMWLLANYERHPHGGALDVEELRLSLAGEPPNSRGAAA